MRTPGTVLRPLCLSLLLVLPDGAHAADGKWSAAVNGDWHNGERWDSGQIATGSGAAADFSLASNGALAVTLSQDEIIGHFISTTRTPNFTGAGRLTFQTSVGTPTITARHATFGISLAGTQGIEIDSTGIVTFSAANTYSGVTLIKAGTLEVSHAQALGSAATLNDRTELAFGTSLLLSNGVTIAHETIYIGGHGKDANKGGLYANGVATWGGTVVLNGTTTLVTGSRTDNRVGTDNASSELVISGSIVNGASGVGKDLQISGLGTVTLSGVSTYTGNTTLYRGTLRLSGGHHRLPTGTILELGGASGGSPTFDLNGWNQSVLQVTTLAAGNTKTVTNSAATRATLTVTGNGESNATLYTGNLSLEKQGSGNLIVASTSSYTGDTFVREGTLTLAGFTLHDDADVHIDTGATLHFTLSGTDTISSLFLDGEVQAIGTYGRIASGAQFEVDFITGNGFLHVTTAAIPEPGSVALGLSGLAFLASGWLRRRFHS